MLEIIGGIMLGIIAVIVAIGVGIAICLGIFILGMWILHKMGVDF